MPLSGKRKVIPSFSPSLLFETAVFSRPNEQAIFDVESGNGYTFTDLSRKANQLARLLQRKIFEDSPQNTSTYSDRKGPVIALCMVPSAEVVISLLAVLKLEAAYVPLEVTFPTVRMEYIIKDVKPNAILTNGMVQNLEETKLGNIPVIDITDNWSQIGKESSEAIHLDSYADDPLFAVLYTSGSTGKPKGVKLGWKAVLNRTIWQWDTFPFSKDEVVCFKTALTFVDSIGEIFGALLSAHKLIIIPKRMTYEVEEFIAILAEHKVERLTLVPSLLRSMLFCCSRSKNEPLPHLRSWFCSGEVFPSDLLEEFFRIFPNDKKEIFNIYGCTENLADLTCMSFKYQNVVGNFPRNVSIGVPILNCDVYVANKKMEEVPEGTIGEILTAGKCLCQGYIGTDHSENLILNPFSKEKGYEILYKTGDFGRIENGMLYYEGRKDSQIKIRGHRIDLMEVQNCLHSITGISNAHVLCYHPGMIDQMLIGFYIGEALSPGVSEVVSELELKLTKYMIPQVYKIEEMPLLYNNKIDRQKLLEIYEKSNTGIPDSQKFSVHDCPKELCWLANILLLSTVKALGPSAPDCITLDHNYFQIGGNSLNILLVLRHLQDAGYFIEFQDFIKAANFREMLSKISTFEENSNNYFESNQQEIEGNYSTRPINEEDLEEIIVLLVECFARKGVLELEAGATYNCLMETAKECINTDFKTHFSQLSFILYDRKTKEIVGVSLNLTHDTDANYVGSGVITTLLQFTEDCGQKASANFQGKKTMHSYVLATKYTIPTEENPKLVYIMEKNNIKIAKAYNYDSILTTNSSVMTQQICQDLLDYKVLGIFQPNLWLARDGTRPLSHLRDTVKVTVEAKYL